MVATLWRKQTSPLDTYRGLVQLLHADVGALLISCLLQTALCAAVARRLSDVIAMELVFVIAATVIARLAVVLSSRHSLRHAPDRQTLQAWEDRHAVAHLAGGAAIGAMGAWAAGHGDGTAVFMFAVVVTNLAMDLVARASGRPWICSYALAISSVPATLVLLCDLDIDHLCEACALVAGCAASLQILKGQHRALTVQMNAARSYASLANADPLTGLSNRLALCDFLERGLASRAPDEMVAVHCLDLDRFKEANDRFGHAVGDDLLKAFARRLRRNLSPDDLLARLGGDEFVIVQCGLHRKSQAGQLAESILRLVDEAFQVGELAISIGVSIGIAVAASEADTAQLLLSKADAALYAVKRRGRSGYGFAEPDEPAARIAGRFSTAA